MHRIKLFIALSVIVCSSCLHAQEQASAPYITVSGYAEDWVDPDIAVWVVKIQHYDKDLNALKVISDREYERVMRLASELGQVEGSVFSGRIQVSKIYNYDKNHNRGDFRYFKMTRVVTIEQYELSLFDSFLDRLLLNGDFDVQLQYKSTTVDEVKSVLRLKAIQVAREKALALATELNASIGSPMIISEYPIISDYTQIDRAAMQAGVLMSATPERIQVRQKIYVRFELIKPVGDVAGS